MSPKSGFFAPHRALAIPEIVCEILLWANKNSKIWCRTPWLLNCALVNKTWCYEALRILWSDMEADGESLDEVMMDISPDRRQMYYNFVKTATVTTYSQETESAIRPALENLVFPQLHTLRLIPVFHGSRTEKRIRIPTLSMPNLETLYVNRSNGPVYLCPDQWDYFAYQIPVCFTSYYLMHRMTNHYLYISRSSFRGCWMFELRYQSSFKLRGLRLYLKACRSWNLSSLRKSCLCPT